MNHPAHKIGPAWHYKDAERDALALEELLKRHEITIPRGSPFEEHVLRVMKLGYDKELGNAADDPDVRGTYRILAGVHELANRILEVKESPSFPNFLPHLRMLNVGASLQNTPSVSSDQVTNKLFELFVATLAIRCGTNVTLDDPYASTGTNPDVLATFGGRRWGIACKVLHGLNPEGFMQNLAKGVEQIERSPAEIGVVIFNMKNVFPHDKIWPLAPIPGSGDPPEMRHGAWHDSSDPYRIMLDTIADLGNGLVSYLPPDYLDGFFRGQKSIPGFLLWAHSVSAVRIDGRPTATTVRAMVVHDVAPISSDVMDVIRCLDPTSG